MAGWDLKEGSITDFNPGEDLLWSLCNGVFSDSNPKRNTYKFGFIKALLDNVFNGEETTEGIFFTYEQLFARFAENYWNLVTKYQLRQMRPDGKSVYSKVELIIKEIADKNEICSRLEFSSMDLTRRRWIISNVTAQCRKYVVGALYADFNGVIYSFDLKAQGLTLSHRVHEFFLKYKPELEKLNYYAWARFLERVNSDSVVTFVLDKLDSATPRRSDLSVYRQILRQEFEENTCFYCGKKLGNSAHVDHFIPWSYVKDDKLWNFVLSCPTCNTRKNNKLPQISSLIKIQSRNRLMMHCQDVLVQKDFAFYTDDLLDKMYHYAKLSGLKNFG